ncbi:testis-expressed protein 29 isoform X2 [Phacochoerus africanus]|uniref:testis-expressed protein 29 isoform X2 n=1 Tax=Phacochoerus africanus TaxID=41426 RepID=UPI001FDA6321|nr:testis-expressed protein 29 isoform X2 [Phacochoerus africanus]
MPCSWFQLPVVVRPPSPGWQPGTLLHKPRTSRPRVSFLVQRGEEVRELEQVRRWRLCPEPSDGDRDVVTAGRHPGRTSSRPRAAYVQFFSVLIVLVAGALVITIIYRVIQESRREKEVPTEIPLSSKPSAKSEPAPPGEQPATASAASKVSSSEPEMPLEGEEDDEEETED